MAAPPLPALEPMSDCAALEQRIDFALDHALFLTVFGDNLGHEIILALESRQILLRELAPLRADVLEDSLFVRVGCFGT